MRIYCLYLLWYTHTSSVHTLVFRAYIDSGWRVLFDVFSIMCYLFDVYNMCLTKVHKYSWIMVAYTYIYNVYYSNIMVARGVGGVDYHDVFSIMCIFV